jgi:phosphoglycolate phosphatase
MNTMQLPPFDAVLFDFDGTLAAHNLDFADMHRQVLVLTLTRGLPRDEIQHLYILELIDYATNWLQQRDVTLSAAYYRQVHQLLEDIEVASARENAFIPGVQDLLTLLKEHAIAVGIVTRNCNAAVRAMFPDLEVYCQAFLARDHVTQVKPHPAHLKAALDLLGCTPDRTLMIGDGAMDMQAGKQLNMFSIGVLTGTSTRESLIEHGADLVFDTVVDLRHYLPKVMTDPL